MSVNQVNEFYIFIQSEGIKENNEALEVFLENSGYGFDIDCVEVTVSEFYDEDDALCFEQEMMRIINRGSDNA